ncbi:hypothetical protein N9P03_01090 [bacterium]|nr:hypothetical protein [bacterium]
MYYDEPIDRYHSQPFSYHAETNSLALQKLSQNIWKSFKDEDRTNIDGTSNNKGKILGQDYLRLTIIQLFAHWKNKSDLLPDHFKEPFKELQEKKHPNIYEEVFS